MAGSTVLVKNRCLSSQPCRSRNGRWIFDGFLALSTACTLVISCPPMTFRRVLPSGTHCCYQRFTAGLMILGPHRLPADEPSKKQCPRTDGGAAPGLHRARGHRNRRIAGAAARLTRRPRCSPLCPTGPLPRTQLRSIIFRSVTQRRKAMASAGLSWPLTWWAVLDLNQCDDRRAALFAADRYVLGQAHERMALPRSRLDAIAQRD